MRTRRGAIVRRAGRSVRWLTEKSFRSSISALFRPTDQYQVAWAVRQAEAAGQVIRALGNGWSFSDAVLPQSSDLDGILEVVLRQLLMSEAEASSVRHAGSPQPMRDGGRGAHPARLNFGDCFSYEVAKEHSCPLLYAGDDFSKTDLESAL